MVVELGSPEPDVTVTLETRHKNKKKKTNLEIKGRRISKYRGDKEKKGRGMTGCCRFS